MPGLPRAPKTYSNNFAGLPNSPGNENAPVPGAKQGGVQVKRTTPRPEDYLTPQQVEGGKQLEKFLGRAPAKRR